MNRSTRLGAPQRVALLAAVGATAVAVSSLAPAPASGDARVTTTAQAAGLPALSVTTVASGLTLPWDLDFTPDGAVLVTQRGGQMRYLAPGATGSGTAITMDQSDLYVGGEAGLLGVAVDPGFATNRRFYTCQASKDTAGNAQDVRVVRWQLAVGGGSAARVGSPVVSGIPVASTHTGCRLLPSGSDLLFVSTGDAQRGTAPQDLNSLGGKVLRVRTDGTPAPGNPFLDRGGNAAKVYTYGHRNVQGLALSPRLGQVFSVEHGPNYDDEVNRLVKGANYGWDPVPGYNQGVPMTDRTKFPAARVASWSSGSTTRATSGGTFLRGTAWGDYEGRLVVGLLKDTGVMVLGFTAAGRLTSRTDLAAVNDTYGRIRTPHLAPDGSLWLTTSNGGGNDRILRVTPQPAAPR